MAPAGLISMARRRLPELDAMPFGIGDPGESAVWVLVVLFVDGYAFVAQLRDQALEVVHPVEVTAVPLSQRDAVAGAKEDAAETGDLRRRV
jgi:hypothetical protein